MRAQVVNRQSLSGLAATLVGNGIGRFAYIALIPALIQQQWFSEAQASYLGVATLLGYIFGAPAANVLVKYFERGNLVRWAMIACTLSYLCCAWQHGPLWWFYGWRTLAGVAGAMLMVLAPPMIVRLHQPQLKARVSGVVFAGIGMGAMLSGTLIPLLLLLSLPSAWLGMGAISLVATVLSWPMWRSDPNGSTMAATAGLRDLSQGQWVTLSLILFAYSFNAIGYLPHTLFWVDFVVRELQMSQFHGGFFWAMFGLGAAIGPLITGQLGDRLGVKRALVMAFTLKAFGVALPLISTSSGSLLLSSILVGAFTPGTVTLVSTYTLECVGLARHTKAWSMMTLAFALAQGVVGYVMAYWADGLSSYQPLFMVSAAALGLSIIAILATQTQPQSLAVNH